MGTATGTPVPPMLAMLGHPSTGEHWAFESKWDGQRAIATTGSAPPKLWSRNGNNISASFPEIVDALSAVLDHRETVLDGEIFALGPDGAPSFPRLQRRMHVLKPTAQLRNDALTTYYVFDVLDSDGTSTTDLPYLERHEALANLSLEHSRIKVPPLAQRRRTVHTRGRPQTPPRRYCRPEHCLDLPARQAISRLDQNASET